MGLKEYALMELELKDEKDADSFQRSILEIVDIFARQGHSGSSAPYAIRVLDRLLRYKPLSPLTGEDDEWNDIGDCFQNKRCYSVFKEDGKAYWNSAKVFSRDGGESWFSDKDSRMEIEFPFSVPNQPEYIILEDK